MSAHAFLPFSGAPIWGHCSMYPTMVGLYPEEETQEAKEGTAAHWYGEQTVRSLVNIGEAPGPVAPNNIVIDDVMRDSANIYSGDVISTIRHYESLGPVVWGIEKQINAPRIHPTLCGGTPDAWMYSPSQRKLIDWQFKHGHEEVNEFENLQEAVSLSGLFDYLGIDGMTEQSLQCEIRIVQPRCYTPRGSIRTWYFKGSDLRPLWNQLTDKAHEATTKPVARSGNHCLHCPGRANCEASRKSGAAAMDYVSHSAIEGITPEQAAYEHTMLLRVEEAAKTRRTGLEEAMKGMIRQRKIVPDYALQGVVGRLAWKPGIDPDSIRTLGMMYGVDLEKKNEFITPTQAKKAGIPENVIGKYAETPSRGTALVKQGSEEIRRLFGNQRS